MLIEKVISDNGPCFKSEKFQSFCSQFEIHHTPSSPHYHQSNGRAERAIQTIRKILKKSKTNTEITLALLAYHDTPISANLLSPADLFFNRRINTRLGRLHSSSNITEQKINLADKRAAHLKSPRTRQEKYAPQQPIWYTEDGSPEWKPGYIDTLNIHPDLYWIITETNRRIRRNQHDILCHLHSKQPLIIVIFSCHARVMHCLSTQTPALQ